MPGTVLLLAAAPAGKGRLVDAASVLPVLAAVEPAVLSGTDTANVVELADPLDPQAVLTRLRAVAAAPGPLTVYVTGQLHLDRRQRLPHLALARTTPSTVRYTALPWQWVREELRLRPAGATTLLLDLHADQETWEWLRVHPLDCGPNHAVYGRIAPPPGRRTVGAPAYMRGLATVLRSGQRPPLDVLHQQALARAAAEGATGTEMVLGTPGAGAGDSYAATGAIGATGATGATGGAVVPVQAGPAPADLAPATPGPAPADLAPVTPGSAAEGPRAGSGGDAVPVRPRPAAPADLAPARPGPAAGDPHAATDADLMPGVREPAAGDRVPGVREPAVGDRVPGVREPAVGDRVPGVREPAVGDRVPDMPEPAVGDRMPDTAELPADDPHTLIAAAVKAGRHAEADALAARHERAAGQAHGPASEAALHWTEVRADLAMFAGDPVRSCRAWLTVAAARLGAGQAPDAPAVEAAVDRAHHQWGQIHDPGPARELGVTLAELRSRVPGRREGALDHVRRQLDQLQTQG
ncbi:hypothetical protein [Streptomyces fumanus]|uniref:hypothetical protein n=1 Tax=Streptomyces fumanus TaxID=67302 RepID=UPI0033F846BA